MKKIILAIISLMAIQSSAMALHYDENVGCAINLMFKPDILGGEIKLYGSLKGFRLSLDVGIGNELNNISKNMMFSFVETTVGYSYCFDTAIGCSHIYTDFGVATFNGYNKAKQTNSYTDNSLIWRIGYIRYLTKHIGINTEITFETFSFDKKGHFN